jgi:DNA gyrase subunit A
VSALLELQSTERIVAAVTTDPRFMLEFGFEKPVLGEEYEEPYPHFLAISKQGKAFRFCGWHYRSPGKRLGRLFGRLKTADEFVDVIQVYADDNVAVLTRNGKLLCCNTMSLPLLARPGVGVKIVHLSGADEVVEAWKSDEPRDVLLVSGTTRSIRSEMCFEGIRGGKGRHMFGPVKAVLRPPPQIPDFDLGLQRLNQLLPRN